MDFEEHKRHSSQDDSAEKIVEEVKHEAPRRSYHGKTITDQMRDNPWMAATIVLGVVVLVLIFGNFSGKGVPNQISAQQAGNNLLGFFAANGAEGLTLDSVNDVSGVYEINFNYQGAIVPYHVTKDGKLAGSLTPLTISPGGDNGGTPGEVVVVDVSKDDDPVKGDLDAPITIIEFSDYECPFCGRFYEQTLPQLISEYIDTGKVKLVYRDFPLVSIHPRAQKAAEAAECVRKVAGGSDEAYFEMHDKIFDNQGSLSEDNLKLWASDLGYDIENCLDSGEMTSEVLADLDDGESYGVTGTPAFFINGNLLEGAQPYSNFEKIIEEELSS